jgi:hypothetical protein
MSPTTGSRWLKWYGFMGGTVDDKYRLVSFMLAWLFASTPLSLRILNALFSPTFKSIGIPVKTYTAEVFINVAISVHAPRMLPRFLLLTALSLLQQAHGV